MIQNYRIFAPNFFNFKIILATKVFENSVASSVFTFVFSSHCHYSLASEKYNVPISRRMNLPVFPGGMPSPLSRPNPIPVPLFRLVSCGIMLPVVLDGFTQMPSFCFCPKSLLIFYNSPDSQRRCPNHRFPVYQCKHSIG